MARCSGRFLAYMKYTAFQANRRKFQKNDKQSVFINISNLSDIKHLCVFYHIPYNAYFTLANKWSIFRCWICKSISPQNRLTIPNNDRMSGQISGRMVSCREKHAKNIRNQMHPPKTNGWNPKMKVWFR